MSFKADKAALVPTPAPSRLLRTTRVCRLHPKDGTCRMSIYLRTVRLVLMSTSSTLSRQGHLAQAQESPSHHFLGLLLQYVPFPQAAIHVLFFSFITYQPHKYATYGIVPSTAPSSDDESEDTLPRSALNAPIEALQGLANAAAEAAAAPSTSPPRYVTIPRCRLVQ